MSIITVPFSWILNFFYDLFQNYGLAIMLFGLLVKLIMLPFQFKSKKSLMRTSALQAQMKELERRYGSNQRKYQEEVTRLYRREKINPMSGCLWTLIPFPILIALYSVVRQPLTRLMSLTAEEISLITQRLVKLGAYVVPEKTDAYAELTIANLIHENYETIRALVPNVKDIDFSFIGLNLSQRPQWNFFSSVDWSNAEEWGPALGLFLIPFISAGLSIVTTKLARRNNPTPAPAEGPDPMKSMNIMMPLLSIYICFIMPAAMGVYWIVQSILSCAEELLLGGYFRRLREKETAELTERERQRAEEIERRRQETERLRAEGKTEKNENTSKRKIQAQQKAEDDARRAAAERAARAARRARLGIPEEEIPASQVGSRRYARGRAYDPERYAAEAAAAAAALSGTEELPEEENAPEETEKLLPAAELPAEERVTEEAEEEPAEEAPEEPEEEVEEPADAEEEPEEEEVPAE